MGDCFTPAPGGREFHPHRSQVVQHVGHAPACCLPIPLRSHKLRKFQANESQALNLHWGDGHAVVFLQGIVSRYRLAIDPDQVILRFSAGHLLVEEFFDCHALSDVDVISEAAVELSTNLTICTRLQNRT
jgi:hypothetical protein